MNKLQLIIETPRAGKWNHRFIAATDGILSESAITKTIAAARRNPIGDNYIAVSSETTQSTSGRIGKEILVLVGLDVKQLANTEQQEIIQQLEQRLADVAILVTETINWDKDGKEILLRYPKLATWEQDFAGLPVFSKPKEKIALAQKLHSNNKLKLIGVIAVILLVLGVVFWTGLLEDGIITTNGEQDSNSDNIVIDEHENLNTTEVKPILQEKQKPKKDDTPTNKKNQAFEKLKNQINSNKKFKDINCDKVEIKETRAGTDQKNQEKFVKICQVLKNIKDYPNSEELLEELLDEMDNITTAKELLDKYINIDLLDDCLDSPHPVYEPIKSYINFLISTQP
ncbi:MAG: hypothetical protein KAH84_00930 [Thiomargarita sp.]|nr:hypothetical protein [Thiomargarita sp.]